VARREKKKERHGPYGKTRAISEMGERGKEKKKRAEVLASAGKKKKEKGRRPMALPQQEAVRGGGKTVAE